MGDTAVFKSVSKYLTNDIYILRLILCAERIECFLKKALTRFVNADSAVAEEAAECSVVPSIEITEKRLSGKKQCEAKQSKQISNWKSYFTAYTDGEPT